MPIWLRKFTFNELKTHYDKENESYKEATSKNSSSKTIVDSDGKIKNPEFMKNIKPNRKPIKYK